ncbi:MAG: hypothetical protein WA160_11060 [Pseudobdellovibrio sp.]
MIKYFFILISMGFFNSAAFAYPEMIRQHYVNCSACHVSQGGGGVLNAYGRTISYDLLSTWGKEAESRPFYAIDPEKMGSWLNVGGDLRGVQLHQENSQVKAGRYIWMQATIEAAVTVGPVTGMLSFGDVNQGNQSFKPNSTKYYVSYQASDELSVRGGKFIPLYGLQIPQHQFNIKDTLLLGQGTERDTAEVLYNGELWNFALAYAKSNIRSAVGDEEKSISLQMQRTLNDAHKVGISLWSGDANLFKRTMVGLHAISGWTEKFYTLAEIDHVTKVDKTSNNLETKSMYQLAKVGYEFYKGIHGQVVEQYSRPNLNTSAEKQSIGAGAIWYPRPHFEIESLWSKQRDLSLNNTFEDYAYILTHFYF